MENDPAGREYATQGEAVAALSSLTDEEIVALRRVAQIHWDGRRLRDSWGCPDELLHDAIVQTVKPGGKGKRWRKGVGFVLHLKQAMRNLSGHAAGKEERRSKKRTEELQPDLLETQRLAAGSSPVERRMDAKSVLEDLQHYFGPDQEAFKFVIRRAEGMSESEACTAIGKEGRSVETIARRARRKVTEYKTRRGYP